MQSRVEELLALDEAGRNSKTSRATADIRGHSTQSSFRTLSAEPRSIQTLNAQVKLMDPEDLPRSKSVPSNLSVGRPRQVSITSSGSYQSHLSSSGHLHRVRTTSGQISLTIVEEKTYTHTVENDFAGQWRFGRLSSAKQLVTDPAGFLSDDLRRIRSGHIWRLRTLVTLYCCISVVFFTIEFRVLCRALQRARPHHPASRPHALELQVPVAGSQGKGSPTLLNITLSQRMSVTFRGLPSQAHLDTFVVQAHAGYETDLTACLWIEDSQIKQTLSSITEWPGPVSLMVLTTHAPNSTEYKHLRGSMAAAIVSENTSVHLLRVRSINGASSNAYLNMARFFARTSRVALFPNGIPKPVLSSHASWLNGLPVDISNPVILSNATNRAFSRWPLAPVVLPKDYPVWCTDRFYVFGSRILDWEDCLWQIGLESAGDISSIAVPNLVDDPGNTTIPLVSPHAVKIRRRWSSKYRLEACAFSLKRSQALDSLSKLEKRHMQWRKKFCRETAGLGAPDAA